MCSLGIGLLGVDLMMTQMMTQMMKRKKTMYNTIPCKCFVPVIDDGHLHSQMN